MYIVAGSEGFCTTVPDQSPASGGDSTPSMRMMRIFHSNNISVLNYTRILPSILLARGFFRHMGTVLLCLSFSTLEESMR